MLLIPCPLCGSRPEAEFSGGAVSGHVRPGDEPPASEAAWSLYLFGDKPVSGARREYWCHAHGCGQWFLLTRDTETGDILSAERLPAPPMEGAGS